MAVHPFFAALPLLIGFLSPVHEDLEKRIAVLTRRLQESPADAELYVQRAELHRQHQEYQPRCISSMVATAPRPAMVPM